MSPNKKESPLLVAYLFGMEEMEDMRVDPETFSKREIYIRVYQIGCLSSISSIAPTTMLPSPYFSITVESKISVNSTRIGS